MTSKLGKFYEFFAGGGMARLGLGDRWECLFANEWSEKKASSYGANFAPATELRVEDIWKLSASDLPGRAELAWASFPCQDLSLAGNGAGLKGSRSGTLIKFWALMRDLATEGRRVPVIALENVAGALTSNDGRDFEAMCRLAFEAGYRFGAAVIDAARFVPQSRPRLFFIAVSNGVDVSPFSDSMEPVAEWYPERLQSAVRNLSSDLRQHWIWWHLPGAPAGKATLNDIIEFGNESLLWHTKEETRRLLAMMSPANAEKVRNAQAYGKRIVGTIYKRIRIEEGVRVQRAEVRFDQISGCLRTPSGGSSRQTIIMVQGASVRSRLLSPREAARLMGIPDSYLLPKSYNAGYHLAGDGVVVPVVRFLRTHLLDLLVDSGNAFAREAA